MDAKKTKRGDREARKRDGLKDGEKTLQPCRDLAGAVQKLLQAPLKFCSFIQDLNSNLKLSQQSKGWKSFVDTEHVCGSRTVRVMVRINVKGFEKIGMKIDFVSMNPKFGNPENVCRQKVNLTHYLYYWNAHWLYFYTRRCYWTSKAKITELWSTPKSHTWDFVLFLR